MAGNGAQSAPELQKLEGVVEHMIYENPQTGYAVFEVDAQGTDIVVAGNVGSVDNGMSVVVYGHMTTHPNYGEQFHAETCEASLPQDTAATLSYLSSGALPYIGAATARKIIDRFGMQTLDIIASDPEQLKDFGVGGYHFEEELSDREKYVFIRDKSRDDMELSK